MSKAIFDNAGKLDLLFRIARVGSKLFTFVNEDETPYLLTGRTFSLNIKENPGDAESVFSLTDGDGLTVGSSTIQIEVTAEQTDLAEKLFFWELYETVDERTWLCGSAYFISRDPSEEDDAGEVIVRLDPDAVTVIIGNPAPEASEEFTWVPDDETLEGEGTEESPARVKDGVFESAGAAAVVAIDGLLREWDNTENNFPDSGGSGTDGAIEAHNHFIGIGTGSWEVVTGDGSVSVEDGAHFIAKIDDPGNDPDNWWTTLPGGAAYTAGSGVEINAGVVEWGSSWGGQTVTDGFHNIDPINQDAATLSFGEVGRFDAITMMANNLTITAADAAAFVSSIFGGYGASSVFNAFGIIKNSGGIDGNYIKSNNGGAGLLSSVTPVVHLRRALTGVSVAGNGVGGKIIFDVANSVAGDFSPAAGISYILTDVTNGSEDSKYVLSVLVNGVETTVAEFAGTPTALVDASSMALTNAKHTLASSSATRTFTISYTGDDITLEVTLNTTAATYTFPASALCVSEGTASGANTLTLSGVSGDKYIIAIKKMGSAYYVVSKNFGQ
jgi:hypothetical protein